MNLSFLHILFFVVLVKYFNQNLVTIEKIKKFNNFQHFVVVKQYYLTLTF